MKKLFLGLALCLLAAPAAVGAQEQPLASFDTVGTPRTLGAGSGNLGFRFSTPKAFVVTAMGYFDPGGNSLASAHPVALFGGDGQEIKGSRASVGPNAPLERDGFRYVAIAPLRLDAGTYILSAFAGQGKASDNGFTRNVGGLKLADSFKFEGGIYNTANEFGAGTTLEPGFNYFGPNLKVAPAAKTLKVACVGDSITFGSGVTDRNRESYPAVLQKLLGDAYSVVNFGIGGATLLQKGDKPYQAQPQFKMSGDFAPDIVVIMLGTNDAKPANWANKADFLPDYRALIAHYATLPSHPRVFVALSPPVYGAGAFNISPTTLETEVVPLIGEAGGATIDVRSALSGHPEWFPDTVHPNKDGAAAIAQAVSEAIQP